MTPFATNGCRITEPDAPIRRNVSPGFHDDTRRVQRVRDLTDAYRRQVEHILRAETPNDRQAMAEMDREVPALIADIAWQLDQADRLLVRNEDRQGDAA